MTRPVLDGRSEVVSVEGSDGPLYVGLLTRDPKRHEPDDDGIVFEDPVTPRRSRGDRFGRN
jgi:hypothetical protein